MENALDKLGERVKTIQEQIGLKGADEKVFQMVLYCSEVMPKFEELGTTEMRRVEEIDKRLCALWRKMLDKSYRNITRYYAETEEGQKERVKKRENELKENRCLLL